MRIDKKFAEYRLSEVHEYKPKYFIVSEGSHSEPAYFDGLNNSIITENITIINILRDYASLCNSHPSFIVSIIKEFILNVTTDEITILEIKNKIENCIHDNEYNININDIYNEMISIYKKEDYRIKKENLNDLFLRLFKSEIYKDLAKNFAIYFETQNITYSNSTDKLCMIIDRDQQNFKDFQYDEVVTFCGDNNVNLYVSNPTFEFWLMLHFKDVEKEDKTKMFENRYVNNSRRYLEKRLHDICKYKKSKLDFKEFEPFIFDAIKREKNYEENIIGLKKNLGSNVGLLVSDMLNQK